MMKSALAVLALSASVLITTTAAQAAEPYVAPAFDWTGPYVGLQAGYGWDDNSDIPWGNVGGPLVNNDGPLEAEGFLGGVYAGYNYQVNQFVIGLEGDVNYFGFKGDDQDRGGDTNGVDMNFQANARLRAGFAIDNTLLYAAGGWSYTNSTIN